MRVKKNLNIIQVQSVKHAKCIKYFALAKTLIKKKKRTSTKFYLK